MSVTALAVILVGALLGGLLRKTLPKHHLEDDTKDYVRLGTGLIATIAALVLGLLIASANSSYDTESSQVRHLTANIVLLDTLLSNTGQRRAIPATTATCDRAPGHEDLARGQLGRREGNAIPGDRVAEEAFAKIQGLSPKTETQSFTQGADNSDRYRFGTNPPAPV